MASLTGFFCPLQPRDEYDDDAGDGWTQERVENADWQEEGRRAKSKQKSEQDWDDEQDWEEEEDQHAEERTRSRRQGGQRSKNSRSQRQQAAEEEEEEEESIMQPVPGTGTKPGESGWYHHNGLVAYFHCSSQVL